MKMKPYHALVGILLSLLKKIDHLQEELTGQKSQNETGDEPMSGEQRLLTHLMRRYEPSVRPMINASQPLEVKIGLTLINILEMDEKNQILVTSVWLDQEWTDEMLVWNAADFGGISAIRIPCGKIWRPDIVLYNNADDFSRSFYQSRAMVHDNGFVFWPTPSQFKSTCKVDVTYFPFDAQHCHMRLGSWTYTGYEVYVTNRSENIDLSSYIPNGEFELVYVHQIRRDVFYSCCPGPYPDVIYFFHIRRKVLYYMLNVILPCLMMSLLTLLVYCLPPESGEKIGLGITVLLAFSVFGLQIAEKVPETSESAPLIGVYLSIVMAMTGFSVVMTVIVLNFHHSGPFRAAVPNWARVIFLGHVRKFLGLTFPDDKMFPPPIVSRSSSHQSHTSRSSHSSIIRAAEEAMNKHKNLSNSCGGRRRGKDHQFSAMTANSAPPPIPKQSIVISEPEDSITATTKATNLSILAENHLNEHHGRRTRTKPSTLPNIDNNHISTTSTPTAGSHPSICSLTVEPSDNDNNEHHSGGLETKPRKTSLLRKGKHRKILCDNCNHTGNLNDDLEASMIFSNKNDVDDDDNDDYFPDNNNFNHFLSSGIRKFSDTTGVRRRRQSVLTDEFFRNSIVSGMSGNHRPISPIMAARILNSAAVSSRNTSFRGGLRGGRRRRQVSSADVGGDIGTSRRSRTGADDQGLVPGISAHRSGRRGGTVQTLMEAEMLNTLQMLMNRQQVEDASEDMSNEWKQLAAILDKCLFWLFLSGNIFASITFLIIVPLFNKTSEVFNIDNYDLA